MVKVEEFQKYGKEQMETAVASAGEFTKGVQAIMTAYSDYSKRPSRTAMRSSKSCPA